jgi:hypothetical protein
LDFPLLSSSTFDVPHGSNVLFGKIPLDEHCLKACLAEPISKITKQETHINKEVPIMVVMREKV